MNTHQFRLQVRVNRASSTLYSLEFAAYVGNRASSTLYSRLCVQPSTTLYSLLRTSLRHWDRAQKLSNRG